MQFSYEIFCVLVTSKGKEMKTVFCKSGSNYTIANQEDLTTYDKLPVATYSIKASKTGYYLSLVDDFEMKVNKLYGDTQSKVDKILNTFEDRVKSTGVLLSGVKGSGKSLLTKKVSLDGLNKGYPTIVVNSPCYGESFNTFISQISQPCVLIFDEFEKVYTKEEQEQLLTLFDGTVNSKKLFLLTCNDKFKIDRNMINRPGRIYYMFEYEGLSRKFVMEYVEDNLNNKSLLKRFDIICNLIPSVSYDILSALVEECNRYNQDPLVALEILNIKPEFFGEEIYKCQLYIDDNLIVTTSKRLSPLSGASFYIEYFDKSKDDYLSEYFYSSNMVTMKGDYIEYNNGKSFLKCYKEEPTKKSFGYAFAD